ncbi:odorant receptor 30a-like [Odontomachus brunneus]|uniref:odorant receptor 30a-like n=1 Tax=Odontomachus brunneus TaxID=486640 RepID=UPI0013F2756B|nr:odorant receptor 30a-like [Odontomachus brunneus]
MRTYLSATGEASSTDMKGLTLEKIIMFLRLGLKFACCWPMPRSATNYQILSDKLFRLLSGLHAMLLVAELAYTIIYHVENVRMFMQSTCAMGIMFEVPLQILLFSLQHDRLQSVITQMEDYYRQAKPYERDVFQRYVNKCTRYYMVTLSIMSIAFVGSIVEPLFRGIDSYPLVIKYPFVVDQRLLWAIVYLHQTFGLYQVYCQATGNAFLALLLWFTSARFEILSIKFRKASKYFDWQICVREHQELLRFAQEMSLSITYVVLSSLSISTFTLVFGGVTILSRLPLSVKAEFAIVCISSMVKVFLCAWPADHLMSISSDIGNAAYKSLWYEHGIPSQRIMLYTLLRSQRPVIITVPGLLTALSFEHYSSYISTAFSFLTTFRIILSEDKVR